MDSSIWSHPITVVLVASLIGVFGFLIKMILNLSNTQKATTAILDNVVTRQNKSDDDISHIKEGLDTLIGEHRAMLRAGNLLSSHGQKKTA